MRKVLIVLGIVIVVLAGLGYAAWALRVPRTLWLWVLIQSGKPDEDIFATEPPPAPDYASSEAWAALPYRADAADTAPAGFAPIPDDAAPADVFFVHPTTYFGKQNWNQPLDDAAVNQATDERSIRNQASVFNGCCRIYAPRYRQATFYVFIGQGDAELEGIRRAYVDVKEAFRHYLETWNDGRPFLIASHSQGSRYALWLIQDMVQGTPLEKQFVNAYVVGYAIPSEWFSRELTDIGPCERPDQTGCVASWSTYAEGADTSRSRVSIRHRYGDAFESNEGKALDCTNPLTWDARSPSAGAGANIGAWIYPTTGSQSPAPIPGLTGARCEDGALYITPPDLVAYNAAVLPGKNYHNYDYQLFYMNIRENAALRVKAFLEQIPSVD
ncbi:MAG: DUF3089 domain-containing protein [Alphaproteobacteria bacterium]|nr:DUF3089 domain-containing protein [Alphaproteobacteria bacterium]